ncbi:hypothetical protein PLICRDRAFT_58597 [Plicaturopsis crispa FD-325 SS-3]|uniref:Uncharacterized protein n=1 Tax=Plicaturopsis crispa FD-325 SS-3 TaxID=944288 RepID=A0A0C9SVB1_PLICR|nr:hypothetical protein PLICRDRAFT_58597 [Plicaturopsis crispa FD-325 SS-3]
MAKPSNPESHKMSRILAALDNPALTGNLPEENSASETPLNAKKRKTLTNVNEAIADSSPKKRNVSVANAQIMPGLRPFALNYDKDSPVRRIDMGGHDQGLRMAEFVTKSIDNLSHGLSVRDGMEQLGLQGTKDLIPGLEVRLLPHQIIGVSWMLRQELHSPYKGGILADDMGLGKTVQMIALMAKNMPELDDTCRTTLIVVPAALLQQWKDEIEAKSNDIFTVHVHHGKDKLKTLSALRTKDVIVTTYQTLNSDFITPDDLEDDEESDWLASKGGVLARMKWYRAILDEAQFIRNRNTRSSRSVAMVRSKYRWMLTGTPDIYGLIRFGRFRPWNNWSDFETYVVKQQSVDPPLAGMRAQEILKPLLLRRTKGSTIEGEPILKLPSKDIELVKLEFSEEERDLYDSFEKRANIRLSKFIRAGTVVKNNAAILAMILRMRQLCCHPNLILSQAEGYEDPTLLVGSDTDKECGRALKTMGIAWVTAKRFLSRAIALETLEFPDDEDEPDNTCPVCHDMYVNDKGRVLTCGHEVCFDCLLELSSAPPVHDCIFGYGSENDNLKAEKEYEAAAAKGHRPCPTCKKMNDLSVAKVFKSSAFEPSDEEFTAEMRARRQNGRCKPKKRSSSDSDDDVFTSCLPSPKKSYDQVIDLDESSDDEDLPDMAQVLAGRGSSPLKKKVKTEKKESDDDDILDLTMDDITTIPPPSTPSRKAKTEDDSDIEMSDSPPIASPVKRQRATPVPATPAKGKEKAQSKAKTGDGPSEAVIKTWRNGADDLEPSTKMVAMIELLKEWDCTGDKSIVFSQWTSMLDLVEKLFSRNGIRSLRYDGKMDRASRDQALATFKKAGGPKRCRTRCGGVGLNLVAANRIIKNYAAESQAYDRVHRLGQEKDVFVKRLVVRNTIEERMLQLQDLKVGLAEAALGEGTGMKLHKMSVKEIKLLFGMAKKDDVAPNGSQD